MKLRFAVCGLIALLGAALIPVNSVKAQDSALLDALVKKGVLSDQEAEDIRSQDQTAYNQTAASKISLASSIKTITFYGDVRLRYELRDGTTPGGFTGSGGAFLAGKGDSEDRSAFRYRLRFGIKGTMYDNFFFGIRAATNPNYDRSGNVTFGHSDAAGPFGKDQSLPGIDQVYLGWHATDDITLTGGQMPNPFYTTAMIWSDDLNPAGAAEQFDKNIGDGWDVFATAGQFVYQAANGNGFVNGLGGGSSFSNTFMYGEQIGFKYNFNADTFVKAGATMWTYSGTKGSGATTVAALYSTTPLALAAPNASPSFFNGPFVGAGSAPLTNVSGINDLAVLEVPFEYDFKIGPGIHSKTSSDPKDAKSVVTEESSGWSIPMRIFGDFAYNIEADERADQARAAINGIGAGTGNVGVTAPGTAAGNAALVASAPFQGVLHSGKGLLDQTAYEIGVEAGQLKKKGDWDAKLYWQSTGYYAVDPNLTDADIFNAATNMQGAIVSVAHNWTDGVSSTLRYAYGMPVNGQLATPNVGQDLQEGDIRQYNLFQADLMWKF
jgi:hypothetical protein